MKKLHHILKEALENSGSPQSFFEELEIPSKLRSWCIDLQHVPQGTKYHPEYTVWNHTWLILKALQKRGWEDLYETGFFHDFGKLNTTLYHHGKITSYGHGQAGMKYVDQFKDILYDDHEDVRWMVKRHMDFHLKHKRFSQHDKYPEPYDRLERLVMVDKGDSRELFYELFDNPYKLLVKHQREERSLFKNEYIGTNVLHIPIGISGSGKSTYIKENFDPSLVVSSDDVRRELTGDVTNMERDGEVWQEIRSRLMALMESCGEAVLDATNVSMYARYRLLSQFNYATRIAYVFHVDPEECKQRVKQDLENGVDRSNVSDEVIDRQYKNFKDSIKKGLTEFHIIHTPVL